MLEKMLNDPKVPEAVKKQIRQMMENMQKNKGNSTSQHIDISVNSGDFDSILKDPQVPESFKKIVREMRDKMRDFHNKHGKNQPEAK